MISGQFPFIHHSFAVLLIIAVSGCMESTKNSNSGFAVNPENLDSSLTDTFRSLVIKYQHCYPVKKPKTGMVYIYGASFVRIEKDTFFCLTRTESRVTKGIAMLYGIYEDAELKPFLISDSFKYSYPLVRHYKQEFPDSLIFKPDKDERGSEGFTPLEIYKLKNGIPEYNRTDTVWRHWD